jgi:hypothetical protein
MTFTPSVALGRTYVAGQTPRDRLRLRRWSLPVSPPSKISWPLYPPLQLTDRLNRERLEHQQALEAMKHQAGLDKVR